MDVCATPDSTFPMKVDVYYPIVEQGAYGNTQKRWILDRTELCYFMPISRRMGTEEVKPNVNITLDKRLVGRTKKDLRLSSNNAKDSITNIVLTNIRTFNDEQIYIETAGPRAGKSTLYEVESQSPFVDPFGSVQHYSLTIRRSENQATDL